MTRLERYIERGEYGETPGRVAYVLKPELLGAPADRMRWQRDESFNAAEELLKEPSLKDVYKQAIAKGYAIVVKSA